MKSTQTALSVTWLPENVHSYVIETLGAWRDNPMLKQEVVFIERAFYGEGMKKIWERMDKIPEAPMKLAQLLVDSLYTLKVLPENYEAIRDRKDRLKAAIVRLENERKKLLALDHTGYIALPLADAIYRVQQNLGGYDYLEKNVHSSANNFGIGRKVKTDKASFLKIRLDVLMREWFGKPKNELIADICRHVLGEDKDRPHTAENIASLSGQRRRRNS